MATPTVELALPELGPPRKRMRLEASEHRERQKDISPRNASVTSPEPRSSLAAQPPPSISGLSIIKSTPSIGLTGRFEVITDAQGNTTTYYNTGNSMILVPNHTPTAPRAKWARYTKPASAAVHPAIAPALTWASAGPSLPPVPQMPPANSFAHPIVNTTYQLDDHATPQGLLTLAPPPTDVTQSENFASVPSITHPPPPLGLSSRYLQPDTMEDIPIDPALLPSGAVDGNANHDDLLEMSTETLVTLSTPAADPQDHSLTPPPVDIATAETRDEPLQSVSTSPSDISSPSFSTHSDHPVDDPPLSSTTRNSPMEMPDREPHQSALASPAQTIHEPSAPARKTDFISEVVPYEISPHAPTVEWPSGAKTVLPFIPDSNNSEINLIYKDAEAVA
ncbi:hypothetical protein FPV67DRAFT_1673033 [Lyophyllum atratum]|nr:hypothetical protein FPV67DRAFT_1673033 [Lyophyllum atratum]